MNYLYVFVAMLLQICSKYDESWEGNNKNSKKLAGSRHNPSVSGSLPGTTVDGWNPAPGDR